MNSGSFNCAEFQLCTQNEGFSQHVGPFYQRTTDNRIQRALPIDHRHLNPEGVVHGGALTTFMDYVIYRAIGDEISHEIQFATINLNCQFLAAGKAGDCLLGEGKVVRKTKSVIFAEGIIFCEARQLMSASGIWKIIGNN